MTLQFLKEFPAYDTGQLEDDNVKLLGIWMWDTYDVLSTVPLRTLDDFVGKKCGAWGIYYPKWLEAIGSTGISTPAVERYIMLKQGLIDATFHPIEAHVSGKDYEVAKHYTFLSAGVGPNKDIVMNLDVWNGLPADIKKVFTDVYTERVVGHGERCLEIRGEKQAFMETQGVTFYTLGEADKEEWACKIPDLVAWWVERMDTLGFGDIAPQMAKRWITLAEENGHTWYSCQKKQWSWVLE
jgi:TRAP-type C4-dicarboxylate transport system substrate-binding protein